MQGEQAVGRVRGASTTHDGSYCCPEARRLILSVSVTHSCPASPLNREDRPNWSALLKSTPTVCSRSRRSTAPPVRRANITITNSVGRLSTAEIDQMIKDAESFKQADKEFSSKHEAKQELESYIAQVESTITSPDVGMKIKRHNKSAVEAELAKALEKLEVEDVSADELRKAQLHLKCVAPYIPFYLKLIPMSFIPLLRRAMSKAMSARG